MAQKAAKAKTRGQGGSGRTIMTVVLMIPVIAVLLPSCVVLLINMAPTAVAWMVDRARPRYLAITVGMLNFCGSLPAEFELWRHGQSYGIAFEVEGTRYEFRPGETISVNLSSSTSPLLIWECPAGNCRWSRFTVQAGRAYRIVDVGSGGLRLTE